MTFTPGTRVRYVGTQTRGLYGRLGTVVCQERDDIVRVTWDDGYTRTTGIRPENLNVYYNPQDPT